MAMACFAERAPCLPSRTWWISSRTNSPACVLGERPCRRAFRARSMVAFSGIGLLQTLGDLTSPWHSLQTELHSSPKQPHACEALLRALRLKGGEDETERRVRFGSSCGRDWDCSP